MYGVDFLRTVLSRYGPDLFPVSTITHHYGDYGVNLNPHGLTCDGHYGTDLYRSASTGGGPTTIEFYATATISIVALYSIPISADSIVEISGIAPDLTHSIPGPGEGDHYFDHVYALFDFEGVDESINFIDHSNYHHTVSVVHTRDAIYHDSSRYLFGTSSLRQLAETYPTPYLYSEDESFTINSSSFYLGVCFTIEFAFRPAISNVWTSTTGRPVITFYTTSGQKLQLQIGEQAGIYLKKFQPTVVTILGDIDLLTKNHTNESVDPWYRVALCGNFDQLSLYLDGTCISTVTDDVFYQSSIDNIKIYEIKNTIGGETWVDELRITKNICRYTNETYSLATATFPKIKSTQLGASASIEIALLDSIISPYFTGLMTVSINANPSTAVLVMNPITRYSWEVPVITVQTTTYVINNYPTSDEWFYHAFRLTFIYLYADATLAISSSEPVLDLIPVLTAVATITIDSSLSASLSKLLVTAFHDCSYSTIAQKIDHVSYESEVGRVFSIHESFYRLTATFFHMTEWTSNGSLSIFSTHSTDYQSSESTSTVFNVHNSTWISASTTSIRFSVHETSWLSSVSSSTTYANHESSWTSSVGNVDALALHESSYDSFVVLHGYTVHEVIWASSGRLSMAISVHEATWTSSGGAVTVFADHTARYASLGGASQVFSLHETSWKAIPDIYALHATSWKSVISATAIYSSRWQSEIDNFRLHEIRYRSNTTTPTIQNGLVYVRV